MRVRGYIDGILEGDLVGWAVDEDEPRRRLTIRGTLDGVSLGTRPASEPRRDLRAAGIGDGSSGFRFEIDFRRLLPGTHELAAVVEESGTALPLTQDWAALDADNAPILGVRLVGGSGMEVAAGPK